MNILVLNAGSSSQKCMLFALAKGATSDPATPLWEGQLDWSGPNESLKVAARGGQSIRGNSEVRGGDRQARVEKMLQNLWSGPAAVLKTCAEIDVVGHRIVHGGPKLTQPTVVTPQVKQTITDVSAIAPLHNQAGLQGIELLEKLAPGVPQLAVFDTGFHSTLPLHARVYPGPYEWYERGIQRYGFHGINHEYCAARAAQLLQRDIASLKTITCHLGNGCSLAAIDAGQCVDTTMGFTPLEGLMMGTRSGSIDPGILTYLARTDGAAMDRMDGTLNRESGLLGISGASSDMREILSLMRKGHERARLAFAMFVHRLRGAIAAMAASLGGLDALVFTAGIGENSPEVRRATCEKLGFLGIAVDEQKNSSAKGDGEISSRASQVRVLVLRAQEDWAIAQKCAAQRIANAL
jgi:acetate kinase